MKTYVCYLDLINLSHYAKMGYNVSIKVYQKHLPKPQNLHPRCVSWSPELDVLIEHMAEAGKIERDSFEHLISFYQD